VHDVTREVSQQVAARDPGRQEKPLLVRRALDAAFDLEPVPIEIGQANAVADQSEVPSLSQSESGQHCRIAALC
jgi:hypothetical protein